MKAVFWGLIFFGVVSLAGCDSVDTQPSSDDITEQSQTLDFEFYKAQVNPIFNADIGGTTCSSSGCHRLNDGSGGNFRLVAGEELTDADLMLNFTSASAFANLNDPAQSALLLEPLAGAFPTVGGHAGGDIFEVGDDNYNTILEWISNPVTH